MNSELKAYSQAISKIVEGVTGEEEVIKRAARAAAESIVAGNLLHVIGRAATRTWPPRKCSGESGGLAVVNSILDPGTNLIHGAKAIELHRRLPGTPRKSSTPTASAKTRRSHHHRERVRHQLYVHRLGARSEKAKHVSASAAHHEPILRRQACARPPLAAPVGQKTCTRKSIISSTTTSLTATPWWTSRESRRKSGLPPRSATWSRSTVS